MAHLVSSLGGIARRAVNRAAVQAFARPFAANAIAVSDEDSFLKWTSPEPVQYTHAGILASNETKVSVKTNPRSTHGRKEMEGPSSGEGLQKRGAGARGTHRRRARAPHARHPAAPSLGAPFYLKDTRLSTRDTMRV